MTNISAEILRSSSWSRCWSRIGASAPASQLQQQLVDAYQEPQRKYHTLQHLSECLALFDEYRALARDPDEVEIALWFHDAIYEVRGTQNELKSAEWARRELRQANVSERHIENVRNHILATRHSAVPVGQDQSLLVDIDLSILGASAARFDEYEHQVREEYGWVPEFVFRAKRREILAQFLARDTIYSTPPLRDLLEVRARENLARSLRALS